MLPNITIQFCMFFFFKKKLFTFKYCIVYFVLVVKNKIVNTLEWKKEKKMSTTEIILDTDNTEILFFFYCPNGQTLCEHEHGHKYAHAHCKPGGCPFANLSPLLNSLKKQHAHCQKSAHFISYLSAIS